MRNKHKSRIKAKNKHKQWKPDPKGLKAFHKATIASMRSYGAREIAEEITHYVKQGIIRQEFADTIFGTLHRTVLDYSNDMYNFLKRALQDPRNKKNLKLIEKLAKAKEKHSKVMEPVGFSTISGIRLPSFPRIELVDEKTKRKVIIFRKGNKLEMKVK